MWTFFRAKVRPPWILPTALALALTLLGGCADAGGGASKPLSLYTPVAAGEASGPVPPPPVAYYPYEPRRVRSLDDLTAPVRSAAEAHVRARVGDPFYRQLRFAGGEAVDLEMLHRFNRYSQSYRPVIASFVLRWEFALPEAGLRRYVATLALRADGTVLRPVDLPDLAHDPDRLRLRPVRVVAADLARRGVLDPAASTVTAAYDPARDTFLWHFEQTLSGPPGPEVRLRTLDADARTGEPLRS